MSQSQADLGYNARLGIKGAGATYTYVAEVTSLTPPGWTRDTVDVTHLQSPGMAKEYIGGLVDGGECSITINYIPALADVLLTAFTASRGDFRVLMPEGDLALDFAGIVTGYEIGDLMADDKMSATLTIKATGLPTFVEVTP